MGFFQRLGNWIRGKGWQDQQEQELPEPPEFYEEPESVEEPEKTEEKPLPTGQTEQKEMGSEAPEPPPLVRKDSPELKKAIQTYQRKPAIRDVEKHIIPTGMTSITPPQEELGNLNNLKGQYMQILQGKISPNDPEILDVIINGRKQLQHRFTGRVTAYIDGKIANTLEIVGSLVEHLQIIYNYIYVGLQIDSPPILDSLLQEAGTAIEQQFGAIKSNLLGRNTYKGKISDISIMVTFA